MIEISRLDSTLQSSPFTLFQAFRCVFFTFFLHKFLNRKLHDFFAHLSLFSLLSAISSLMGRTNNLARELQKLAETKAKQDARAQERAERLKLSKEARSTARSGDALEKREAEKETATHLHRDPEACGNDVGSPTSSSSSCGAVEGGMFAAFVGMSSTAGPPGSCRSTSNGKGQSGSFGSSGHAHSLPKNLIKRETRRARQHKNVTKNHAQAGLNNNTCIKVHVDAQSENDDDDDDDGDDDYDEDGENNSSEKGSEHEHRNLADRSSSDRRGAEDDKSSTEDAKHTKKCESNAATATPSPQNSEAKGGGLDASPDSVKQPGGALSFADMLRKKESAPAAAPSPSSGSTPTSSSPGKSQATSPNSAAVKRVYPRLTPQPFSHILVCDFEATCDSSNPGYPHEIIEFPVVCLDTATLETVAIFHTYVKPTKRPRLTKFCTDLTGIRQSDVDGAPTIVEALVLFRTWLHETVYPLVRERLLNGPPLCKNLKRKMRAEFVFDDDLSAAASATGANGGSEKTAERTKELEMHVCFATDGPWDMKRFVVECHVLRDGITFPPLFYRYINVRRLYSDCMKKRATSLMLMLRKLGLGFLGRQHSGIDDTKNIARVVTSLLSRGYRIGHISVIKYGATHMYVDDSDEDGMDTY